MDESEIETETALHRTRLRYLDHKNFAKEFLCKPYRHPATLAGFRPLAGFATCATFCELLQKLRHSVPVQESVTA
ncbi:hypothetical protein [Salmonella enterica]|uniref:hypothetical protein n=1 Tax=Salmonella enterica TaxID=28901 RepID=UPI00344ED7A2